MMNIKLPKENKDMLIEKLKEYFELERGEEIGSIAAEGTLDFMIQVIGPHIYNQAIRDARKMVNEKVLSIEDELYTLEKPIKL